MDRTAAEFAAGGADTVVRRGKLFHVGDFKDKSFSLTAEEMRDACREFQPVPLDLDHADTILSGKLGRLREVRAEGGILFGAVEIPRWLHETIGGDPLKVSCTWDRATKRLTKLALVTRPRITDAALFAAFSQATGADDALFAQLAMGFEDEPRDEQGRWTSGGSSAGKVVQVRPAAASSGAVREMPTARSEPRPEPEPETASSGIDPQQVQPGDRLEWPKLLQRNKPNPQIDTATVKGKPFQQLGRWVVRAERADGAELNVNLSDPLLKHTASDAGAGEATLHQSLRNHITKLGPRATAENLAQAVKGEGHRLPDVSAALQHLESQGSIHRDPSGYYRVGAKPSGRGGGDLELRSTDPSYGQGGLGFSLTSLGQAAEFDEGGSVHWVTINGAHVPITDQGVGPEHVSQATSRLGIGYHGHTALHAALDSGKIETDAHLYGVIRAANAHQAKGASEADAYAAAIASHGQEGPSVRITGQGSIKARGMAPLPMQATADLLRLHEAAQGGRAAVQGVREDIGDDRVREAAAHAQRLKTAGLLGKAVEAHKAWRDKQEQADQARALKDLAREQSQAGQGGRGLVQEAGSLGYDVKLRDPSTGRVHTYHTLPDDLKPEQYEEIYRELSTTAREHTRGGAERLYPVPVGSGGSSRVHMFTLHDLVVGEKKLPGGSIRRKAAFGMEDAEFDALFSDLSQADRDRLDAEDFGDPGKRLYPICDQDDVDSAAHLIGKADNPDQVKRRIIQIAKRKQLRLPDAWKEDGAGFTAAESGTEGNRMSKPSWLSSFAALFTKAGVPKEDVEQFEASFSEGDGGKPDPKAATPAPVDSEAREQVKQLQSQLAAERQARLRSEAAAFAKDVVTVQKRALPAEFSALQQQYLQAAGDDLTHGGEVTFGADQKGSRTDALRAAIALRPAHQLTEELMQTDLAALFNRTTTDEKDKPPVIDPDAIYKRRREAMNGKEA